MRALAALGVRGASLSLCANLVRSELQLHAWMGKKKAATLEMKYCAGWVPRPSWSWLVSMAVGDSREISLIALFALIWLHLIARNWKEVEMDANRNCFTRTKRFGFGAKLPSADVLIGLKANHGCHPTAGEGEQHLGWWWSVGFSLELQEKGKRLCYIFLSISDIDQIFFDLLREHWHGNDVLVSVCVGLQLWG